MTKVLLFWELIPEETKVFLLDGEDADVARRNHRNYGNTVDCDEDANNALYEVLARYQPIESKGPFHINEPVDVVIAGFIL